MNQFHVALLQAKKEMGIDYTWSESVKYADFARVILEYAENGYKLITGDSFGAERIVRRNLTSVFSTTGFMNRLTFPA